MGLNSTDSPHDTQRKPNDVDIFRDEWKKGGRSQKAVSDYDADSSNIEGNPGGDPLVQEPAPQRGECCVCGALHGEHGSGGDSRELEGVLKERLKRGQVPCHARLRETEYQT